MATTKSKKKTEEEALPRAVNREDAEKSLATQSRVVRHLQRLAENPPQVLILEGGTAADREALALFWTARLNCQEIPKPCLGCRRCTQALTKTHRDLFFLDGSEGTIKIDMVREVRSVLGEPPRDDGYRVVILHEAPSLTIEASNALLKSLEEPRPGTSFLLLTPQRERLLPTLVSRGWVLTLSWPATPTAPSGMDSGVVAAADTDTETYKRAVELANALAGFLQTGRGWFQITGQKGSIDRALARRFTILCQRELARTMTGAPAHNLGRYFAHALTPRALRTLDVAVAECQQALDANVKPELVLDWLATRLHAMR